MQVYNRKFRIINLLILLVFVFLVPVELYCSYVLDTGDLILLVNPEDTLMTGEHLIGPDGTIVIPIVGEVKIGGLSISQATNYLNEVLLPYVKEPKITIEVKEYGSFKIAVVGEVLEPNVYPFPGKATIWEAIASAGGFTPQAKLSGVVILRGLPDKYEKIEVNLDNVIDDGKYVDVRLERGDVVVVPRKGISKFGDFLEDLSPLPSGVSNIFWILKIYDDIYGTNK